ncbi:MAG: DNA adenine methylase, partial [Candidatus Buchananbacteria bacterium]|nr:DNA adenine methylase [Candidatus Buchananbacteria bacterium]
YFKKKGYKIIANDIQYYSYVLNRHYIGNHKKLNFVKLTKEIPSLKNIEIKNRKDFVCVYLSNLKGVKGFIYKNYCLGGTKNRKEARQYFSDENGMRCDAIRQKIENWKKQNLISDDEYYFLVTSLVESIDKYANTASVYGAFLKNLKKTAQNNLILKPAELIINDKDHDVFNADVNEIIEKVNGDILYLDPPYNHRQYATNYHLLETIAKYDNPRIRGKTGLRDYDRQKSLYCSRRQVKKVFRDLILKAKTKYIFLSYNNEGLMTLDDIKEIMGLRGKYGYFTKEYNRFKADKLENRNYSASKTVEYLHYVICQ